MTKYGKGIWGQFLYGSTSPQDDSILWAVEIDWDNDEVYDGSNEASRLMDLEINRGTPQRLDSEGGGFLYQSPGRLRLKLSNADDRFSPYNSSSPIYPVEEQRLIRVRNKHGSTGSYNNLFHGIISNIRTHGQGANAYCDIEAFDGVEILKNMIAYVGVKQGYRIDQCMQEILTAVNWPSYFGYDLGEAKNSQDYFWVTGESAFDALFALNDAEYGDLAIMGDGSVKFLPRMARTASVATLTDDYFLRDGGFLLDRPSDTRRNYVSAQVYPRVYLSDKDIYTMQDKPKIKAGRSKNFIAELKYNNRSVASYDSTGYTLTITANTAEDGSGSDISGDFSGVIVFKGSIAEITISNANASDGYIQSVTLNADCIDIPDVTSVYEDRSNGGTLRSLQILENKNFYSLDASQGYVSFVSSLLNNSSPGLTVQMEGRPDLQFGLDLLQRVTVNSVKKNISNELYKVAYIHHQFMQDTGQGVRSTFKLESAASADDYMVWDVDNWDQENWGY